MPTFETKTDISNEHLVAEVVGRHLNADLKPNSRFASSDFATRDGSIHVEIRCRNCARTKYSDIIISASKWIELLRLKVANGQPRVYFAVCWIDAVGILEVYFGKADLVPFHRAKSVGTHMADVMVTIPIGNFEIIGRRPELARSKNWME